MMKKVDFSDVAVEQSPPEARRVDRVVGSVLGVVAFIYATALFNVIFPYHRPYTTSGAAHLLGLTTLTLLGVASYLTCVFCDPGAVPEDWTPDPEASAAVLHVKRSGALRWCQKCDGPKPPRAHHCRRCRRCVLRMDHHCVWINNCVGHGNYRAFFQMALYLSLAATHATFLLLGLNAALVQLSLRWDAEADTLADKSSAAGSSSVGGVEGAADSLRLTVGRRVGWAGPFWAHALVQLAATAVALPLCLSLVTLLVWNCHLLAQNKTTIEHHEGVAAKLNAAAAAEGVGAGRSGAHPWDLGDWHANVNAVFGDEALGWVTPGRPAAEGTGTAFQTQWDNVASAPPDA